MTPEEKAVDMARKQYLHFLENKDKPMKEQKWFNPHTIASQQKQKEDEELASLFDDKYSEAMKQRVMELKGIQTHTGSSALTTESLIEGSKHHEDSLLQ